MHIDITNEYRPAPFKPLIDEGLAAVQHKTGVVTSFEDAQASVLACGSMLCVIHVDGEPQGFFVLELREKEVEHDKTQLITHVSLMYLRKGYSSCLEPVIEVVIKVADHAGSKHITFESTRLGFLKLLRRYGVRLINYTAGVEI